ncbi:MAG: hypothetical protein JO199_08815, partial [Candidatus Eremiobacteraeota bacterium]|nr:hypothetical protein [Candidatus Eremiobacteraeota bacterium]
MRRFRSLALVVVTALVAGCAHRATLLPNASTPDAMQPALEATATATETVLHRFAGGNDGANPVPVLIDVRGRLYGTTITGGGSAKCPPQTILAGGCGTVFEISIESGKFRIVHHFSGGSDGALPYGGLIESGSKLYGAATAGGTGCSGPYSTGCGTIFWTSGNAFGAAYAFKGGSDGQAPGTNLTSLNG